VQKDVGSETSLNEFKNNNRTLMNARPLTGRREKDTIESAKEEDRVLLKLPSHKQLTVHKQYP
jgi:hypothetical protein